MKTASLTNIDLSGVPKLYETEDIALDDKYVYVKLFTPWSNWTWYIMESGTRN